MSETQINWNSMKKGFFDNSVERTKSLISEMSKGDSIVFTENSVLSPCGGIIPYTNSNNMLSNNLDVSSIRNSAIETLEKNPKMLEYKFKSDKTLEGILVHSNVDLIEQPLTPIDKICRSACNVYAAIQLFFDTLKQKSTSSLSTSYYVILTSKLSSKCNFGVDQHIGGSKSRRIRRRKHARKTHHTHARKTHHKRKHRSRAAYKHKKYSRKR